MSQNSEYNFFLFYSPNVSSTKSFHFLVNNKMWFIYSIYLLLGCAQHTQYDWYKILSFHHFLPFSNMNQNVIATPTPYLDAIERNNRHRSKMQYLLSSLDGVDLNLEYLIKNQIGVQPLPFVGMDSKYYSRALRLFFIFAFRIWNTNLRPI